MTEFSIEKFAADVKEAMDASDNRRAAAAQFLADAIEKHGAEDIIEALQAAVPPGASVGEMIVHASPELTMLFARIPPRFESGVHDHTVCACIGQLTGEETNTIYRQTEDGLEVVDNFTVRAGKVLELPKDVIHSIANPGDEPAMALHLYAGDFTAISDRRSLWDAETHDQMAFSFPKLVEQSVKKMKKSGNRAGLDAIAEAIPAVRPMVDA